MVVAQLPPASSTRRIRRLISNDILKTTSTPILSSSLVSFAAAATAAGRVPVQKAKIRVGWLSEPSMDGSSSAYLNDVSMLRHWCEQDGLHDEFSQTPNGHQDSRNYAICFWLLDVLFGQAEKRVDLVWPSSLLSTKSGEFELEYICSLLEESLRSRRSFGVADEGLDRGKLLDGLVAEQQEVCEAHFDKSVGYIWDGQGRKWLLSLSILNHEPKKTQAKAGTLYGPVELSLESRGTKNVVYETLGIQAGQPKDSGLVDWQRQKQSLGFWRHNVMAWIYHSHSSWKEHVRESDVIRESQNFDQHFLTTWHLQGSSDH